MTSDARLFSNSPSYSALLPAGLSALMDRTAGAPDLRVGLIDGPVIVKHREFSDARIEPLRARDVADEAARDAVALHATSTAGVLVARRASRALGICPGVTLVTRSVFTAPEARNSGTAPQEELAEALVEVTDAGARLVNLSLSLAPGGREGRRVVEQALDYAACRGALVVAAAGNDQAVGGSPVTRHPAVVPVVAYARNGRPGRLSTVGPSIGRRGVGAVTDGLVSLGAHGGLRSFGGTSAAAAVITGAVALLWSAFPDSTPGELAGAVTDSAYRRASVLPPVMDASRALDALRTARR